MQLVKREVKQTSCERWRMRAYIRTDGESLPDWQEAFALAQTAHPEFRENGLNMNYPYWRVVGKRVMVYQTTPLHSQFGE